MDENKEAKLTTPIAILIAGVIIAGALFATTYLPKKAPNDPTGQENTASLDNLKAVTKSDMIKGSPEAKITIVEYSDLECPFCKQFHNTMNEIMKAYPNGEVAWVFRHFPLDSLHQKARVEAEAAKCISTLAGNNAFWNYIDKIFIATKSNDGLDLSLLPKFATEVGVTEKDFTKCIADEKTKKAVQEEVDEAILAGGQGTPFVTLITNQGEKIDLGGAVPLESLKQIIDEKLASLTESN